MEYVERKAYLGRMRPFVGNGNAKIVSGIRRSGKSTFLRGLDGIVEGKVLRIDMELWENRALRDPDSLYRRIRSAIDDGYRTIVIDEIQDVKEWQGVVRSLIAEQNCDIFISGSNSKLLSGEFATLLTGRYNMMEMFTLTFPECIEFAGDRQNPGAYAVLDRFLRVGGFPSVWKNEYSESEALSEVKGIVDSILMRDIVSRYDIRRPDLLEKILRFLCDTMGSRVSINSIHAALSSTEGKLSKDLVYSYVSHLESACLIYKAEAYDVKGKRILTSAYKYYPADVGIKNVVCGFRPDDIQGYVENIIFLHMRSRGYDVWIGDCLGKEIDFICRKGSDSVYIQATTRLADEKVVDREFGSLRKVRDSHPKFVVVLENSHLDADMDGIKCVKLTDFLMMFRCLRTVRRRAFRGVCRFDATLLRYQ
ncbi:MAG: ATP-binding protein [Candidatus Methanomethylophilaceae archaeon]|nr:ATP-binding protein [Candidatus Methanomethylophilaceae archaeon]